MELESRVNYLKTIVDNLHDMIWVLDVEDGDTYCIAYVNPAGVASVGRAAEDLTGKYVADVTGPENLQRICKYYRKTRDERQIIEETFPLDVGDMVKHFEIKFIPILNAVGDCVQIVTIGREVSEQ